MRMIYAIAALLIAVNAPAESVKDWYIRIGSPDLNTARQMAQAPSILTGYTEAVTNVTARKAYPYEVSIRDNILAYTNSLAGLGGLDADDRYLWVKGLGKASFLSASTAADKAEVLRVLQEIKGDEDQAKTHGGGIGAADALQENTTSITPARAIYQSPAVVNGWNLATIRSKRQLWEEVK